MSMSYKQKQWAASWGLHESIIMASVRFEDRDSVLRALLMAVRLVGQLVVLFGRKLHKRQSDDGV